MKKEIKNRRLPVANHPVSEMDYKKICKKLLEKAELPMPYKGVRIYE